MELLESTAETISQTQQAHTAELVALDMERAKRHASEKVVALTAVETAAVAVGVAAKAFGASNVEWGGVAPISKAASPASAQLDTEVAATTAASKLLPSSNLEAVKTPAAAGASSSTAAELAQLAATESAQAAQCSGKKVARGSHKGKTCAVAYQAVKKKDGTALAGDWCNVMGGCNFVDKIMPKSDLNFADAYKRFVETPTGTPKFDLVITWLNSSSLEHRKSFKMTRDGKSLNIPDLYYLHSLEYTFQDLRFSLRSYAKSGMMDFIRKIYIVHGDLMEPPNFLTEGEGSKLHFVKHSQIFADPKVLGGDREVGGSEFT
jgi:hypothetical protein